MGLVSGLLLLPLAPVHGTIWVADHLLREARRQSHDPRAVQARLTALNHALDAGDIDEAAFEREEERLLTLLEGQTGPVTATDRSQGRHV
ncbi:gas vesicle protein GvpG [Streptomyces ziwulingensis]|uniref:Gas vesicle protein GvpG n=1 Tax=Streptomyces ziwulingensis TaxID=1045501 RepID=A0ABP9B6E5_9ACTN